MFGFLIDTMIIYAIIYIYMNIKMMASEWPDFEIRYTSCPFTTVPFISAFVLQVT